MTILHEGLKQIIDDAELTNDQKASGLEVYFSAIDKFKEFYGSSLNADDYFKHEQDKVEFALRQYNMYKERLKK